MKQLLLVILFPSFLFAQEEWEHVATSSNKDTYSIRNTIKQRNSDNIVFWVKVQKPDKIEKTESGSIFKGGDYVITKYEADCDKQTLRTIVGVVYDKNGAVKLNIPEKYLAETVIIDSVGETFLNAACRKIFN